MIEKSYTAEQLDQLKARAEAIGPERIKQVEAEWPALIAEVRAAMEAGDDPRSEKVRGLARRWSGLVAEFTGGDPGIERSAKTAYQDEPGMAAKNGLDPALFAFIGRAMAAD